MKKDYKDLNLEELKELVFEKNVINKVIKDRLFKIAKSSKDLETIEKLANNFGFKSAKIFLNKLDNQSLDTAIQNKDFELFKKFVDNGADISKIKVSDLIEKKYDDEFIKIYIEKAFYINTAELVKKNYKIETIKFALENVAKVDEKDRRFNTALSYAVKNQQVSIVKLLIEYKADVNMVFDRGMTCLHLATHHNNAEVVKLLLENDANINSKVSNGFSAIIFASSENNLEAVKLLLEYGANINDTSANGGTPLILAVEKGNYEITKYLLENGAEINHKDKFGATALDISETRNNTNIINLLLQNDAERGDEGDRIPELCEAFLNYDIEQIGILLTQGHNIDEEFNNTNNLIQCSALGYVDIVNLLLDYAANINYQTKMGWTALIIAVHEGQYEVVNILLKRGADKNIKGYQGFTALDIAKQQNNKQMIELLKDSNSFNTNKSDYLKDKMKNRVENDYKELIANKVEELGVEKATEYIQNISSPDELQKEIGTIKQDSTPFIVKSLRRRTLSNEEMSKDIIIKGVGTYDGVYLHDSLRGVKFTSIQTNIGYFLDFPYLTSISDPYSNCKLTNGIDWSNKIGTTIKRNDNLIFIGYSNHIFINSTKIKNLENRCFYSYGNDEYQLIKKIENYDYDNSAMYEEFFSQAENCDDTTIRDIFEKYYLDYSQYLDVDKLNSHGNTALLSISWRGNLEAIKLLIYWGANIDFQNKEGYTPLMLATDRGHYEICKVLLENGANPHIKNFRGQNSSNFATKNMNPEIIELFEDYDIEIKDIKKYIVNNIEEKNATEISKQIEQKLQIKEKISEFLTFALHYNYEYELDLDYYIETNKDYLVSVKPARETRFNKIIVDLYFDMHSNYLDKLNINDESKNHIRTKIYDILMEKYQLGKYENSQFNEPLENSSGQLIERLYINKPNYYAEISIYNDHIILKTTNNKKQSLEFLYKKEGNNLYKNNERGTLIISKTKIIEKDNNGGQNISEYKRMEIAEHNPKLLTNKLKKFSEEKLRYTNHDWDSTHFNFIDKPELNYENFIKYVNQGWNEIKDDIGILSDTLHNDIESCLFSENLGQEDDERNTISWGNDITIGWSSSEIKIVGNKPHLYKITNDSRFITFKDVMDSFKSLFVMKQGSKTTKILKKFTKLRKENNYNFKLDLEQLKTASIDNIFTDITRLESALSTILSEINERVDTDKNNVKITIDQDKTTNTIILKIIHLDSISHSSIDSLSKATESKDGGFKSIYNNLISVCDWSVVTYCNQEKKYFQIDYLKQEDTEEKNYHEIPSNIEGFTHILRFYI